MGLLVGEDVAGGAFIVISKMSNSVLQFCSVSRVEVADLPWAVCSRERDSVTRVSTGKHVYAKPGLRASTHRDLKPHLQCANPRLRATHKASSALLPACGYISSLLEVLFISC